MKQNSDYSLRWRIGVMAAVGSILLLTSFFYYNFILLLVAFVLLLIAFFSIGKADSSPYSKAQAKTLFVIPVVIAGVVAIIAYVILKTLIVTIGIIISTLAIYSLIQRKILLSFNGYRVYTRFYAVLASLILLVLGLYVTLLTLLNR